VAAEKAIESGIEGSGWRWSARLDCRRTGAGYKDRSSTRGQLMWQKEQDQLLFESPAPARHANANAPSLLFPTASQSAPLTSKPWHYTRARACIIYLWKARLPIYPKYLPRLLSLHLSCTITTRPHIATCCHELPPRSSPWPLLSLEQSSTKTTTQTQSTPTAPLKVTLKQNTASKRLAFCSLLPSALTDSL
jgi:hypothetical protein